MFPSVYAADLISFSSMHFPSYLELMFKYWEQSTGVPPYSRVIHSKTYRDYVKPRIIPNAIYNVIFV
jgi:hypothetical protein